MSVIELIVTGHEHNYHDTVTGPGWLWCPVCKCFVAGACDEGCEYHKMAQKGNDE